MSEVAIYPAWRQAVQDFLGEFTYGDLVSHAWLEERFGMLTIDDSQRLTANAFRERQFAWLGAIEAFKHSLLTEHQVMLESVRGQGYRWAHPAQQTAIATRELEREAGKVFRQAGSRLKHMRFGELTDEQRRENVDAQAKMSALRGTVRKVLR